MKTNTIISPCVVRSSRDEKPLHYVLKIESFSLLKDSLAISQHKRYESQNFNAGGYKWKLALYPNGDETRNGSNHISLYLVSTEDNTLSNNLDIDVMFIFLVYDSLKGKYLTVQDGKPRRFSAIKTEWGFEKLIPLETFNDASNGLLVNDCCVFGVDIFVAKNDGKGEVFSLIKQPKDCKYTRKFVNFSKLLGVCYESTPFTLENCNWKIRLYPNGCSNAKPGYLSLYLMLDSLKELPQGSQVYLEYKMAIVSCFGEQQSHKRTYKCWFGSDFGSASGTPNGTPNFISLSNLKESPRELLSQDILVVKVKINVISTLKNNL